MKLLTTKMNFEKLLDFTNKILKTHNFNPFESSLSLSIWSYVFALLLLLAFL